MLGVTVVNEYIDGAIHSLSVITTENYSTSELIVLKKVISRFNVVGYEVIPKVLASSRLKSHAFVTELNDPKLQIVGLSAQEMLVISQIGSVEVAEIDAT